VSFDASKTQPPAGEPVAVAWYFGDGSPVMTAQTPTISHVYAKPGHYTVTLAVYGQQDTVGSVATLSVTALAVATSGAGSASGLPLPLLSGLAALVALAIIGGLVWTGRRRLALERERLARIELARARRVNGPRNRSGARGPRDPRDPGIPARQGGPPPGYRVPPREDGPRAPSR
jgi:hypothetical protein